MIPFHPLSSFQNSHKIHLMFLVFCRFHWNFNLNLCQEQLADKISKYLLINAFAQVYINTCHELNWQTLLLGRLPSLSSMGWRQLFLFIEARLVLTLKRGFCKMFGYLVSLIKNSFLFFFFSHIKSQLNTWN